MKYKAKLRRKMIKAGEKKRKKKGLNERKLVGIACSDRVLVALTLPMLRLL